MSMWLVTAVLGTLAYKIRALGGNMIEVMLRGRVLYPRPQKKACRIIRSCIGGQLCYKQYEVAN